MKDPVIGDGFLSPEWLASTIRTSMAQAQLGMLTAVADYNQQLARVKREAAEAQLQYEQQMKLYRESQR